MHGVNKGVVVPIAGFNDLPADFIPGFLQIKIYIQSVYLLQDGCMLSYQTQLDLLVYRYAHYWATMFPGPRVPNVKIYNVLFLRENL